MLLYEHRTVESGTGLVLDDMCNTAQATMIDGLTISYIVRVEFGTLNRIIYHIAILDDPGAGRAWNGRLAVSFGGGGSGGGFPVGGAAHRNRCTGHRGLRSRRVDDIEFAAFVISR